MLASVRAFAFPVVAVVGLAGSAAAAADSILPDDFPQLFYNDTGWLDGILPVIASFDVLGTAFWNQEGPPAARLDSSASSTPSSIAWPT